MKAVILNGSPRKKWNTDLMLREAEKGAFFFTIYIDMVSEWVYNSF